MAPLHRHSWEMAFSTLHCPYTVCLLGIWGIPAPFFCLQFAPFPCEQCWAPHTPQLLVLVPLLQTFLRVTSNRSHPHPAEEPPPKNKLIPVLAEWSQTKLHSRGCSKPIAGLV